MVKSVHMIIQQSLYKAYMHLNLQLPDPFYAFEMISIFIKSEYCEIAGEDQ